MSVREMWRVRRQIVLGRFDASKRDAVVFTALAGLVILFPLGASAVTPSTALLMPPYGGTVSSGGPSSGHSGCATAKATIPAWNTTTGRLTEKVSSKAKACATVLAGVGATSSGNAADTLSIAFPIRVSTNGTHTVATTVTANLGTSWARTTGGCPTTNVTYPQPPNSWDYAECASSVSLAFSISAYVMDLGNYYWVSNGSAVSASFIKSWMNYTYCDNWIGTGPSCSNVTGPSNSGSLTGQNAPGYRGFTWNGSTALKLWTNGTGMLKAHHYALVISLSLGESSSVVEYNLQGFWLASARASINMGTLGNGATIGSVTIT